MDNLRFHQFHFYTSRLSGENLGFVLAFLFGLLVTFTGHIAAQDDRAGTAPPTADLPDYPNLVGDAPDEEASLVEPVRFQEPAEFQEPGPIEPIQRQPGGVQPRMGDVDNGMGNRAVGAKPVSQSKSVQDALLGGVDRVDALSPTRRSRAMSPGADAVIGVEAKSRETTDAGNLLGKSLSTRGVSSQQRTPIVTDTRIRGERVGQVLASGSFWTPVRMDLDTMMNKIDSRLIDSLIVIKGPYSPRYGPGFSFVDFELVPTPRYESGFESHGTTSLDYQSNGDQWYGRQTFFGGGEDYGYRVSYGHRAGSDYETGAGFTLPSSYKSGDLNIALGWNLSDEDRLEFNYLRLDQSDLEFPGLVYDIRYLVTDAYELKYVNLGPEFADYFTSELWYNRTRFEGDTFAPSKAAQIPSLSTDLFSPSGFDGAAITDGDGMSFGYRSEAVFGTLGVDHWALGTDLILQKQGLNDIEIFLPPDDNNFPLAPSRSTDIGFYAERIVQPSDSVKLNAGVRTDIVNTNSDEFVPGVEYSMVDHKEAGLEQNFLLWSTYATAEIYLTEQWTGSAGVGFGQRPPTLTEMYVDNAFIGSLQRGLTFLDGDPLLDPETTRQIDLGLRGDYDRWQGGVNWYYAWISDFITYDLTSPADDDGGLTQGASFVNTDLATLSGIESFTRYQCLDDFAIFGTLSYIEGEDRTREKPSRLTDSPRSGVSDLPREALPGIVPLESRVGCLWHDPNPKNKWGIELSTRMVARQDRVAESLQEEETPGFATLDLRSYRRIRDRWLLTGGVENMTNRFYREHLDYRSGFGVFRPGINFYMGVEVNY